MNIFCSVLCNFKNIYLGRTKNQLVAFVDHNIDPCKSRPVTELDPKTDIGWAMSATNNNTAATSISNGSTAKGSLPYSN